MSNLKWYQTITTVSKKVGGPKNLLLIVFSGGALAGIGAENGIRRAVNAIKSKTSKKHIATTSRGKEYDATADGKDNNGFTLSINDKFRVLETDGNAVLIEKLGDDNNPYFVSVEFLASVSSFNANSSLVKITEKTTQMEENL